MGQGTSPALNCCASARESGPCLDLNYFTTSFFLEFLEILCQDWGMNSTEKIKDASPLVQSVLSLDHHFGELERLSHKIGDLKLKSDGDFEQARRLMKHFAEHGEGTSQEIVELSKQLQNARERAEAAAHIVSQKAALLQARHDEEIRQTEAFHSLAEKVNALGQDIKDLKKPNGESFSGEDRERALERLARLRLELPALIQTAQQMKQDAHDSKLSALEQQAQSLAQNLVNVDKQLGLVALAPSVDQ
jgi:chromosome segregation ATPase